MSPPRGEREVPASGRGRGEMSEDANGAEAAARRLEAVAAFNSPGS